MQGPCTRCQHEPRTRQDSWPREEAELLAPAHTRAGDASRMPVVREA